MKRLRYGAIFVLAFCLVALLLSGPAQASATVGSSIPFGMTNTLPVHVAQSTASNTTLATFNGTDVDWLRVRSSVSLCGCTQISAVFGGLWHSPNRVPQPLHQFTRSRSATQLSSDSLDRFTWLRNSFTTMRMVGA